MKEKLRKLGLTEYESKIYLALLKYGNLIGRDVQKYSKVPNGRTYEVLGSLVNKGFVTSSRLKPKLFSALKPEIAITQFIDQKVNELRITENELKDGLRNIKTIDKTLKINDKVTLIHTKDQLKVVHRYLYSSTKKYQKNLATYELVFLKERLEAMRKGIAFWQITTQLTEKNRKFILGDINRGIKVKYYPFEGFRMKLVDGKKCLIKIVNNKEDWVAILIESPSLTKGLEFFFDKVWKEAKEVI